MQLHILIGMYVLMTATAWADAVPGEYIVKLKGQYSPARTSQFLGKLHGKLSRKASYGGLNLHHFKAASEADVSQLLEELKNDPDIEYIEPNYKVELFDDPRVLSLEDVQASAAGAGNGAYSQNYAAVKTTEAWQQITASVPEVPVVAVIDTGIDLTHNIFLDSEALWTNPGEIAGNNLDDDGNGYIDDLHGFNFITNQASSQDDNGHGTHVAGIVLGVTQDIFSSPIASAKIRLMSLKFLPANGGGSIGGAVAAIYYAVNNGAHIINNSWGGSSYSQALHDALAFAYQHGVTVVNAAGNYSKNNDSTPMYPASYPVPGAITVAATNDWDVLANFSNFGPHSVQLASPGVGILSATFNNKFRFLSGTSMAAPYVSGVAALVLRESPQLTGYQVRNLIVNSATTISGLSGKLQYNHRVNAYDAVVSAQQQSGVSADLPDYQPMSRGPASSSEEAAKMGSGAAGCGLVKSVTSLRPGGGAEPTGRVPAIILIFAVTLLPVLVWQMVRKSHAQNRRAHDRFVMNSEIKVRVGDRELVGQMNTISMGGLSFKADTMLDRGGLVTIQIASPDGSEQVHVQGRIVWNEHNKAYGVQFANAKTSVLSSIRSWTYDLVKAS